MGKQNGDDNAPGMNSYALVSLLKPHSKRYDEACRDRSATGTNEAAFQEAHCRCNKFKTTQCWFDFATGVCRSLKDGKFGNTRFFRSLISRENVCQICKGIKST